MELTREEAIRLYRELWGWLAENPEERSRLAALIRDLPEKAEKKEKWMPKVGDWVKVKEGLVADAIYDNGCCFTLPMKHFMGKTTKIIGTTMNRGVPRYSLDASQAWWFSPSMLEPAETPAPAPRFAVGDKVVPVSKSIGEFAGDLDSEPNWIYSKKRGYFYVTQSFQHCGKQAYGCHSEDIRAGGNYFLESDLRPYVEPKAEPKPFRVGDRVRIRKDMEIGERHGHLQVCEGEMEKCRGQETFITSVNSSSCCVNDNLFFWYPTMLELLPPLNHCPAPKTVTLETVTVTFKDNKTTCIIENELGRFKGCAKCSPDDAWDEQTGAELAKVRAYRRMLETEERNIRMI